MKLKVTIESGKEAVNFPHGEKRREIRVAAADHLFLAVQPAPSTAKSWVWRATPKGGGPIVKLTLGSIANHSYGQAIAWAEEENRKRDLGHDVRAERVAKAKEVKAEADRKAKTVQWYYDELYAPTYLNDRPSVRDSKRLFEKHLLPAIGTKAITDVERSDLSAITAKMMEHAPVSANAFVNITRTFFKRAVEDFGDETGMETSPAMFLPKPYKAEKKNRRQIVLDRFPLGYVIDTVEDWATGTGFKAAYARALKLVLITGVRINEALEAPWSEFDLEGTDTRPPCWTIDGSRTKNRLPHVLPLPPSALAWLKGLRKADPKCKYLFSATVGGDPMNGYSKPQRLIFAETLERATDDGVNGLEWSPHALRRTFSTELSSLTDDGLNPLCPPHVIEALLNHQSGAKAGVAGVYNKYAYFKEKSQGLLIWEAHLAAVLAKHRSYKKPAKLAA